jgi:ABC-type branched-subunit amino acid transport system ATPase component
MVEQQAHRAMRYADRAIVMRGGRIELSISAEEAQHRIGEVEQAYLSSAGPSLGNGGPTTDR